MEYVILLLSASMFIIIIIANFMYQSLKDNKSDLVR